MVEYFKMLGKTRQEVAALRTGDYHTLDYDSDRDYYAYARTAPDGSAIIVINRSGKDIEVDLPVAGVIPAATSFNDRLNPGNDYTVQSDTLSVKVPARSGALLVSR